jgi:hypothetical protein
MIEGDGSCTKGMMLVLSRVDERMADDEISFCARASKFEPNNSLDVQGDGAGSETRLPFEFRKKRREDGLSKNVKRDGPVWPSRSNIEVGWRSGKGDSNFPCESRSSPALLDGYVKKVYKAERREGEEKRREEKKVDVTVWV